MVPAGRLLTAQGSRDRDLPPPLTELKNDRDVGAEGTFFSSNEPSGPVIALAMASSAVSALHCPQASVSLSGGKHRALARRWGCRRPRCRWDRD